jgi:hypothetical protein
MKTTAGRPKNSWFPAGRLSLSEAMSIIPLFHLSGRRFKWHCRRYVRLCGFFPAPVSCNRFVELTGRAFLSLPIYTRLFRREKPSGAGFIGYAP